MYVAEEKAQPMPYFFSTRREGLSYSTADTAWRYGKGNVFTPPAAHPDSLTEQANARENTDIIVAEHLSPIEHPGVILESQYQKGIWEITSKFLAENTQSGPPESLISVDIKGRITVKGDGLFTTLPNIPLLNRSGDAHSIVIRSTGTVKACGILVGSWHCVEKEIFDYMIDKFLSAKVQPNEIEIIIGPGLGPKSYSLGADVYQRFKSQNEAFSVAFFKKANPSKKDQSDKYLLDFSHFISIAADRFGIPAENIITRHQGNTFDKEAWKAVKGTDKVDELTNFYEKQLYFGARLFSRVRRRLLQLDPTSRMVSQPNPVGGVYMDTGRNLNGVICRSK